MQVMTTNRRYSRGQQPRLGDVKTYWQRLCSCYPHDPHNSCCLAHVLCSYVSHVFCLYSTYIYICAALRATYVWLLLSVCFAYVLIAFHSCFGFIYFTHVFSYVLFAFHECHTDESHMFCLCFTYVLLVLYIRFYFRVMARWLKILVTNDWTYAVHVPKVQESIYSENGRNSWNSQVWTVIHQHPVLHGVGVQTSQDFASKTCSPFNFRSDYPKLDSTCQLLHSWTPTPTWPLCSLHGTVDPPSGGRPEPIGSAKDWIPHDIQSLVSLSRQIL